jgi:hypothetical protein
MTRGWVLTGEAYRRMLEEERRAREWRRLLRAVRRIIRESCRRST